MRPIVRLDEDGPDLVDPDVLEVAIDKEATHSSSCLACEDKRCRGLLEAVRPGLVGSSADRTIYRGVEAIREKEEM